VREFRVPPIATIADNLTLADMVWDNAEQTPDGVAFALPEGSGWRDLTCGQFRDQVISLTKGLLAAGIEPGDRIGLMCRTRFEWTLIDYAIWACGAVTVPVYETSSAEQVGWILSDSGAVACFVETDDHRRVVSTVTTNTPELRHIWQIDPQSPGGTGALADLVAAGAAMPDAAVETSRRSRTADDAATIVYTSGTTGRPKGCVLTHRNIAFDVANVLPIIRSLLSEGSTTLLFLPLAHAFARIIQVGVVQVRAVLAHSNDPKHLVDDLHSFQPTFLLAVPRVFEKLYNGAQQRAEADGKGAIFKRAELVAVAYSEALDTPPGPGSLLRLRHAFFDLLVYRKLRKIIGGRCQGAIAGGAPLGVRLGHFFRGVGMTVYEGYGLTETSPVIAVNVEGRQRIGTIGQPLPGVAVRVDDDGEILVNGPVVFPRYWHNEEATAEAIDSEGWFHTGDLGQLDEDGYLSITGRKKEIIVTAAGKNVAPAVLEDRIRAHPLISQCMVVGDRMPFVAALITLDEDAIRPWLARNGRAEATPMAELRDDPQLLAEVQAAIDEGNRAMSRAESIRKYHILQNDFSEATGELTPSMKIKRAVVLKRYATEIAAIYGG
jgi:long-chain acyl-CoA synthetase